MFLNYWLLFIFSSAVAIPQDDFYPFGSASGDSSVPRGDDNSSPVVPLTITTFPYYGQSHTQLYVNTNGPITFFSPFGTFVPEEFPLASDLQLISPYWVDSDTRNPASGLVWYRITTDPMLLERAAREIQNAFSNGRPFTPAWLLVATWDHVGRFSNEVDVTSTFQCILATDGISSFVFFLYADNGIEWDFAGQVGLNAGDGIRSFSHPDSFSSRLPNIHTTTNVGTPGVWIFKVDGDEVVPAGCSNQNTVPITLTPRYGHLFGGTPIIVTGPCFSEKDTIECVFGGSFQSTVQFVDEQSIICVSPFLDKIGATTFTLRIKQEESEEFMTFTSTFLTVSPDRAHVVNVNSNTLMAKPGEEVTIRWVPEDIIPNYIPESFTRNIKVDILVFSQAYTPAEQGQDWNVEWKEVFREPQFQLSPTETPLLKFPDLESNCILPLQSRTRSVDSLVCPVAIKVSVSNDDQKSKMLLPSTVGAWSGVYYLETVDKKDKKTLRDVCDNWVELEEMSGGVTGQSLLNAVLPCPPTELLARNDRDYQREEIDSLFRETNFKENYMNFFHSGIAVCYRQSSATSEGFGQQCCYRVDGNLAIGEPSSGSADSVSPIIDYNRHISDDIVPYISCCQAEDGTSNCGNYFERRPSGTESGYSLPVPACIYGDPHIVTLDGLKYTFNGKGEFSMIETIDDSFTLQGRMDTILDPDGNPTPGTVFTALVARQHQSSTTVQFDIRPTGIRVQLNGNVLNFDDLNEIITDYVTITDNGNNSVIVFFSQGARMELKTENGIISVMLITLPSSLNGMTRGLMGNFNGDTSDDLIPKFGTESLSINSTIENIHQMFGITWILQSSSESYFRYLPGQSFASFHDPFFSPMFQPSFDNVALEEQARAVCGSDEFCLFDVAATKNINIGMATMQGGEAFNEIEEMARPIVCNPSCVNGACVQNDTCSCSEGFEGDICDFEVILDCDANICENNGTCTRHVLTYTCNCPDGFIGAFCQHKEPEFGISLINSSPRITNGTVTVDFIANRPINFARCFLTGEQPQNCDTARPVVYRNLSPGSYIFRIVSQSISGERAVIRRLIHVGENDGEFCAIHLINEGIVIDGTSASLFFQATRAVNYALCRLRGINMDTGLSRCQNVVRYHDLEVGEYRFQVIPFGCDEAKRLSITFEII